MVSAETAVGSVGTLSGFLGELDAPAQQRLVRLAAVVRREDQPPAHGPLRDQFADLRLIRRLGEIDGDIPDPVRPLERGDRGLVLEKALGQEIDDVFGGDFAADGEIGAMGGRGDRR